MKRYKSKLKEGAGWLPSEFSKVDPSSYQKILKLVSKISRELDWNIDDAFVFCINLLEDVNAHKEAKQINDILYKEWNSWK